MDKDTDNVHRLPVMFDEVQPDWYLIPEDAALFACYICGCTVLASMIDTHRKVCPKSGD